VQVWDIYVVQTRTAILPPHRGAVFRCVKMALNANFIAVTGYTGTKPTTLVAASLK